MEDKKYKGQIISYHDKPRILFRWGYCPSRSVKYHRHLNSAFNEVLNKISMKSCGQDKSMWSGPSQVQKNLRLSDIRVKRTHS